MSRESILDDAYGLSLLLALAGVAVAAAHLLFGCASAPKPTAVTIQRGDDSVTICTTFARDGGTRD